MRAMLTVLLGAATIAAGCGGDSGTSATKSSSQATASKTSATTSPTNTTDPVVEVSEYSGGKVSPVIAAPELGLHTWNGKAVRIGDYHGKVVLVTFVYTHCPDICPVVTARMAELRDSLRAHGDLGQRVRLVSFSVDPGRDTPEILRSYAGKFGGTPPREWAFLTGSPPEQVLAMIQQGFHLAAQPLPADSAPAAGGYEVMHSPRLLLLDRRGRVRGTYPGNEVDAIRQLRIDLNQLLEAEY